MIFHLQFEHLMIYKVLDARDSYSLIQRRQSLIDLLDQSNKLSILCGKFSDIFNQH